MRSGLARTPSGRPRTTPPSGRRTWFNTRLPPGAQNLVDEALAAASIADAPHQDLEFVVVAAHGGLRCFCMAGAEKSLEKSSFFCPRVALPTDRRHAEINGLALHGGIPFFLGIPQSPIPRVHRRDDKVSSSKISVQIAVLNAAQTRCRRAVEWLSEGPFERRFSVRQRQSGRLPDARSANCRRASP
jgi:hypothetical protein